MMCYVTFPLSVRGTLRCTASILFLVVLLLPLLKSQACIDRSQTPKFSCERLSLLAAPAVDAGPDV